MGLQGAREVDRWVSWGAMIAMVMMWLVAGFISYIIHAT